MKKNSVVLLLFMYLSFFSINAAPTSLVADSVIINDEDIFLNMNISKQSLYVNEGFLVTFKLYTNLTITHINDFKFPVFDGFIVQEMNLPETIRYSEETCKGKKYHTAVVRQALLYPLFSGNIPVEAAWLDVSIQIKEESKEKNNGFFDDFFAYNYITVNKIIKSSPLSVLVLPLPDNHPVSFKGAVGEFKLRSSIDTLFLNDTFTLLLRVNITGNGNLKYIPSPDLNFSEDIKFIRLDNRINLDIDSTGIHGSKTFKYSILPQMDGIITIPPIEFTFFDIESKSYKTLKTTPHSVETGNLFIGREVVKNDKENLVFALDISSSMLAEDFKPNRLEAMKNIISDFMQEIDHSEKNIALVSFAGESCKSCLYSDDYSSFFDQLAILDNKMLKEGTAIGDGLLLALSTVKQQDMASGIIVLITDGTNNSGEFSPKTISDWAAIAGVKIITIGLSGYENAPIPITDPYYPSTIKYIDLPVTIDEKLLTSIAEKTGGTYFRIAEDAELPKVFNQIKKMKSNVVNLPGKMDSKISIEQISSILSEFYYNTKNCDYYLY